MRSVATYTAVASCVAMTAFVAHAEPTCFPIRTEVDYCTDAFVLGHVPPDATTAVPTAIMPHVRAWFSDETDPLSAALVLDIPVNVTGTGTLDTGALMTAVLQNADANATSAPRILDARVGPSKLGPWDGIVGQFTSASATTGVGKVSYVLSAFLSDGKVLTLMTFEETPSVTDSLWDLHDRNMSGLRITP